MPLLCPRHQARWTSPPPVAPLYERPAQSRRSPSQPAPAPTRVRKSAVRRSRRRLPRIAAGGRRRAAEKADRAQDRPILHDRFESLIAPPIARRPMCGTVRRVVVSVPLMPLLVPESPALFGLMLPQLRAIPVHVALGLLMSVQAAPFGSFVLPLGIFTPVSGAAPTGTVRPVPVVLTWAVVCGRHIIPRTVTADLDRKTRLSESRSSGNQH